LPTEIHENSLLIRPDHVIEDMLISFGAKLLKIEAPFQPEGGAYGATHSHDHRHHDDHHHHDHADGAHHHAKRTSFPSTTSVPAIAGLALTLFPNRFLQLFARTRMGSRGGVCARPGEPCRLAGSRSLLRLREK